MTEYAEEDLFTERDRSEEFCSLLLSNGYVPVAEFRDLLYNEDLRHIVERRLNAVGMRLIYNIHSEYWGVALNANTAADDRLEWSNNFGLNRGAMALLLILWTKLILPKRLEQEAEAEDDKQPSLLKESFAELAPNAPTPRASISREQITAEFSKVLGGVTNTSKYLAQLARAKLIKVHGGVIEEGPLMSLVIDENALGEDLRRDVLISVLKRKHEVEKAAGEIGTTTSDTVDSQDDV